jgi:small membrane protein
MTIIFQIVAVVVIAFAAFFLLRGGGARHQAIRRVIMLIFIIAASSSVFFPGAWTWVANLVGIGRGADLLLYLVVLIFVGFVATTYRRFRQLDSDVTRLARELALARALNPRDDEDAD